jgi:hypothetical protein
VPPAHSNPGAAFGGRVRGHYQPDQAGETERYRQHHQRIGARLLAVEHLERRQREQQPRRHSGPDRAADPPPKHGEHAGRQAGENRRGQAQPGGAGAQFGEQSDQGEIGRQVHVGERVGEHRRERHSGAVERDNLVVPERRRAAAIEAGLLSPDWEASPWPERATAGGPLVDTFRVAVDESATLDRLGRYEARLERAFQRSVIQLEARQARRFKRAGGA